MTRTMLSSEIEAAGRAVLSGEMLCERARRIEGLSRWVLGFAELREAPCNRQALGAAIWFQDAWAAGRGEEGGWRSPLALIHPPTEAQREAAVDTMLRSLSGFVDPPTLSTAAGAIRGSGRRASALVEARVLGEASALDSIGPLWLWGQIALAGSEDRPAESLSALWRRHADYDYWGQRIAKTLRFEASRELATHRVAALERFLRAFAEQVESSDVQRVAKSHM